METTELLFGEPDDEEDFVVESSPARILSFSSTPLSLSSSFLILSSPEVILASVSHGLSALTICRSESSRKSLRKSRFLLTLFRTMDATVSPKLPGNRTRGSSAPASPDFAVVTFVTYPASSSRLFAWWDRKASTSSLLSSPSWKSRAGSSSDRLVRKDPPPTSSSSSSRWTPVASREVVVAIVVRRPSSVVASDPAFVVFRPKTRAFSRAT